MRYIEAVFLAVVVIWSAGALGIVSLLLFDAIRERGKVCTKK